MSSTQETLLFRVKIEQTGLTAANIDKLTSSLTKLSALKPNSANLGAGLAGFVTQLNKTTTAVNQFQNAMKKSGTDVKSSMDRMASSANALGQIPSKFKAVMTQIERMAPQIRTVAGAIEQISAAFSTINTQGILRVTASIETLQKQIELTIGSAQRLNTIMGTAAGGAGAASGAYSRAGAAAIGASRGHETLAQSVSKATGLHRTGIKETDTLTEAMKKQRGSVRDNVYEMSNYISRGAGMFISTIGLRQAMEESSGMAEALAEAQGRVAEAQAHLEALQNSGIATVTELTRAENALEKAQRGLSVTQRNAGFAASDAFYFMALMGVEIVGVAIPAFIKLREAQEGARASGVSFTSTLGNRFSSFFNLIKTGGKTLDTSNTQFKNLHGTGKTFSKSLEDMHKNLRFTSNSFDYIGKSSSKFNTIFKATDDGFKKVDASSKSAANGFLRFNNSGKATGEVIEGARKGLFKFADEGTKLTGIMGRLVPVLSKVVAVVPVIGWALTITTTAMDLYGRNLGGVRDATEQWGKTTGDTFEILAPIGELLQGVAGKLGMTGESAQEVEAHFARAGVGFANMGTLFQNTVINLQNSADPMQQNIGSALEKLGQSVKKSEGDWLNYRNNVDAWWAELESLIMSGNIEGAIDHIGMAFGQFVPIVSAAFSNASSVITEAWSSWIEIAKMWSRETNAAVASTVDWFGQVFGELGRIFNERVVVPIQEGFVGLVSTLHGYGAQIQAFIDNSILKPLNDWGANLEAQGAFIYAKAIEGWENLETWVNQWIITPLNNWVGNLQAQGAFIHAKVIEGWENLEGWVNEWIVTPLNNWVGNLEAQGSYIHAKAIEGWENLETWVNQWIITPLNNWVGNLQAQGAFIHAKVIEGWENLETWVSQYIVTPINNFVNWLVEGGAHIYTQIIAGWKNLETWVSQYIVTPINNFVTSVVEGGAHIYSKITAGFADLQSWVSLNIVHPINNWFGQVQEFGSQLWAKITGGTDILAEATALGQHIWANITSAFGGAAEAAAQTFDPINPMSPTNLASGGQEAQAQGTPPKQQQQALPSQNPADNVPVTQTPTTVGQPGVATPMTTAPTIDPTSLTGWAAQQDKINNPQNWIGGQPIPPDQNTLMQQLAQKAAAGGGVSLAQQAGAAQVAGDTGGRTTTNIPGFSTTKPTTDPDKAVAEWGQFRGSQIKSQTNAKTAGQIAKSKNTGGLAAQYLEENVEPAKTDTPEAISQKEVQAIEDLKTAYSGLSDVKRAGVDVSKLSADQIVALDQIYKGHNATVDEATATQTAMGIALKDSAYQQSLATLGTREQEGVYLAMQEAMHKNVGTIGTYTNQLRDTGFQQALMTTGAQEAKMEMLDMESSMWKSTAATKEWGKAVNEGHIMDVQYTQGLSDQRMEMIETALATANSAGRITELGTELERGEIQAINFASGLTEGRLELLQQEAALSTTNGHLMAYEESLKTGYAQNIAFTQGIQAQKQELIDTEMAVASTVGRHEQLKNQLAEQTITTAAYNLGLAETRLMFDQQMVSIAQTDGVIQGYNEALASGFAQNNAFTMGQQEQTRAFQDAEINIAKTKGSLDKYNEAVALGVPQHQAYTMAVLEAQRANAELRAEIAGMVGTYKVLEASLNNATVIALKQNQAFMESKNAAMEWGIELKTLDAAMVGTLVGLSEVAASFGGELPQGLRSSVEATKEFIAVMGGVKTVIADVASELYEGGRGIIAGLADGFGEGMKDVDDKIQELEEKLGVDLPEGIEEAMINMNLGGNAKKSLDQQLQILMASFRDPNVGREDIGQMMVNMNETLGTLISTIPDSVRPQVQSSIDMLTHMLQNPPGVDASASAWSSYGATLKVLFADVYNAGNPANDTMGKIVAHDPSKATQSFLSYADAIGKVEGAVPPDLVSRLEELGLINTDVSVTGFNDLTDAVATVNEEGIIASPIMDETSLSMGKMGAATMTATENFLDANKQLVTVGDTLEMVNGQWVKVADGTVGATTATTDYTNGLGQTMTQMIQSNAAAAGYVATLGTLAAITQSVTQNMTEQFTIMFTSIAAQLVTFGTTFTTSIQSHVSLLAPIFLEIPTSFQVALDQINTVNIPVFFTNLSAAFISGIATLAEPLLQMVSAWQLVFETISGETVTGMFFTTLSASFIAGFATLAEPMLTFISAWQLTYETIAGESITGLFFTTLSTAFVTGIALLAEPMLQMIAAWQLTYETISGEAVTGLFFVNLSTAFITGFATLAEPLLQLIAAFQLTYDTIIGTLTVTFFTTLTSSFTSYITMLDPIIAQIPVYVTTHFNTAMSNAAGVLVMMAGHATTAFTAIGNSAIAVAVGVTTNYNTAMSNAAGVLVTMANHGRTAFTAIGASALAVAVGVTTHYNTAGRNATGILNMMIQGATQAFTAIGRASQIAANAINQSMHAAATATLNYIGQMQSRSTSAFQAMASNAQRVAQAVATIGQSAQQAGSQVDALRNKVESLPNIERTITYTIRVVGSVPSGGGSLQTGGSAIAMMEEGGMIRAQASKKLIVGETADERVERIGLRTGRVQEFVAKHMRTIDNLGMHEPEIINVVPTQGYYAKRYNERSSRGMAINSMSSATNPLISRMATGGTTSSTTATGSATAAGTTGYIKKGGWGANKDPRTWTVDRMDDNPNWWKVVDNQNRNVATNFISNQAAQRYIDKALGVDTSPDIDNYEPGVVLHGGWGASRNPADWRVTAMKDNPNLFKVVDRSGDNVATDFTSEAAAKAYIGSGARWGGHDEGKVLHGGWGGNQNPLSWRVVRMKDNPNLWKIVDNKGINIVTDFPSAEAAQAYINKKRGINPGTGTPGGGGTGGAAPASTITSGIPERNDRIPLQDAVNSLVDSRRDPLYLERIYGQVNNAPAQSATNQNGIPPESMIWVNEVVQKILRGMFGKLNMSFTGEIDRRSLWKINNTQLNDSLSRY